MLEHVATCTALRWGHCAGEGLAWRGRNIERATCNMHGRSLGSGSIAPHARPSVPLHVFAGRTIHNNTSLGAWRAAVCSNSRRSTPGRRSTSGSTPCTQSGSTSRQHQAPRTLHSSSSSATRDTAAHCCCCQKRPLTPQRSREERRQGCGPRPTTARTGAPASHPCGWRRRGRSRERTLRARPKLTRHRAR
jgi:hypothetical protein